MHKPLHAAKAKQFLREIDDEQILQLAMMADSAAIELELPLNWTEFNSLIDRSPAPLNLQ